MRKKLAVGLGIALLAIVGIGLLQFVRAGFTSESFQRDADLARLQDLEQMGRWLSEYYTAQGTAPFEGTESLPVYVFVATSEQQKFTESGSFPMVRKSLREFVDELERGVGHKIEVQFDPQRKPVNKPNFYMYAVDRGTYNFAVHLHGPYPFAKELGPHYFKLQVSNHPNPKLGIWSYDELIKDPAFIKARARTPSMPDYIEKLRSQLARQEGY